MNLFADTWNAVAALSRLGRSQLLIVILGSVISTILAGICTRWGGSAFFATIAFLICDVVNAMYSITYENSFAFTSLATLLVEQNVVLTAGTAVGIMDDGEDWVPVSLKWIAVGFGWLVVAVLLGLQLALRKDWGWHAHKLGLARTEDVALYQRILQLEGAILLDFCQVIPCCVVLLGKYGFSTNQLDLIVSKDEDSKLQHIVAILFFVAAVISVVCAPILGSSARRETPTPFGIAGFLTMCTTGMIVFGTVDAMRRVGWPPSSADAILFALVICTCLVRVILISAILRIPTAVFGSGIASRINRGSGGILLPSNIEGWSECRRSAFGGRSTAADTEGAAMLYGNIEDYSDTESDVGANYSNPNLVLGERVKIRESVISRHSGGTANNTSQNINSGGENGGNYSARGNGSSSLHPSALSAQSSSVNNNNNIAGPSSLANNSNSHHRNESNSSMTTFHQQQQQQQRGVMTDKQNTTPLFSRADTAENSVGNLSRSTRETTNSNTLINQRQESLLDDTNETSSNTSRNTRSRSPNTLFVKANVGKKPRQQ